VRALEPNRCDTPFAAVYAFASPDTSVQGSQVPINQRDAVAEAEASMFADRQWSLEGMIGLPTNCPSLPSRIDFDVGWFVLREEERRRVSSAQQMPDRARSRKGVTFRGAILG
jgi:hypothetical protein